MATNTKFTIYKIYYNADVVYVGRTKQPLQNRIRGHVFAKPMHRSINIDLVTRIEFAELATEADMNLYEIYYILTLNPPLNVDDTTQDQLTVTLPEVQWHEFICPLWDKWKAELHEREQRRDRLAERLKQLREEEPALVRKQYRDGLIDKDTMETRLMELRQEQEELYVELWG